MTVAGANPIPHTEASSDRRALSEPAFGLTVALFFCVTAIPRALEHVPWRDEWQAWLSVADGAPLGTLFTRMRYEGHPPLWYLLLWAAFKVWPSVKAMQVTHALIATLSAWILATFAPWPRWQRIVILCGYFLLFEYVSVARNYAPGVTALLAYAAWMTCRPRGYIGGGVLLVVAVMSNAFAAILAGAISVGVAIRWWTEGRPAPRRFIAGAAIVAAGFLLTVWLMRSPPDINNVPWTLDVNVERAGRMLSSPWRAFVPVPFPDRVWWNTNFLDVTRMGGALRGLQPVLGIGVLIAATLSLPRGRALRWTWLTAVLTTFVFGYLKLPGSIRHYGNLYVLFLVLAWLGHDAQRRPRGWRSAFWLSLITVQALVGIGASIADLLHPFSESRAVAAAIQRNYPTAFVIGIRDYEGTAVAGFLGHRIYFPSPGRWGTFVIWDNKRGSRTDARTLAVNAQQLLERDPSRPVVLVVSSGSEDLPDPVNFRLVQRFDDATVKTERFALYEYVGPR